MTDIAAAASSLDEFRAAVDAWLDEHADELTPPYEGSGTLDQQMAHLSVVKRLAYDAGWMRCGWPERVGGVGGTTLRDYVNPEGMPGYFRQRLFVYERAGRPCRRCRTPIRHAVQGARSTYWCPGCQR